MTPLQAAKAHCCNYQPDGTCLGVGIRDGLSAYRFVQEGTRCLLADGKRCQFFEECAMTYRPCRTRHPREATQLDEACHVYQTQSQREPMTIKCLCRACRQREVTGIKRYCVECAAKRKRHSQRASMRKSRLGVIQTANLPVHAEGYLRTRFEQTATNTLETKLRASRC